MLRICVLAWRRRRPPFPYRAVREGPLALLAGGRLGRGADGLRPFAERPFRYLWLALAASTLGDKLVVVALALYVSDVGGPRDVGFVLAASTGSLIVFLLIGGVWADRLPRRRVMMASDLARAALHGALGLLILLGAAPIWAIVAIEVAFGAAEAFFRPAHAGFLPQTVPPALIQPAWAATSSIGSVADLLGPVLATALVLGVGGGPAFLLDGALFLASALLLTQARPRTRREPAPRRGAVAELREGWRALRSRTWAWSSVAVFSLGAAALYAPWLTLGPAAAADRYGSRGAFGLFVAASGAGSLLGTLVAAAWRPRRPLRAGYLALVPGLAAVPAFALGAPLWAALPLALVWGMGEMLFEVSWSALLAQRIPGELLSRVTAFEWLGSMAFMPLGVIVAGTLGEQLGVGTVLLVGTAAYAAAVAAGLAVPDARRLERVEASGNAR